MRKMNSILKCYFSIKVFGLFKKVRYNLDVSFCLYVYLVTIQLLKLVFEEEKEDKFRQN